jgi:hypothetical protein
MCVSAAGGDAAATAVSEAVGRLPCVTPDGPRTAGLDLTKQAVLARFEAGEPGSKGSPC